MLEDFQAFTSRDSSYVALQGRQGLVTVNVRVNSAAIDDLPESGGHPTDQQRIAFVRHNLDAIRTIAERKLERGECEPEEWCGRSVLGIRICDADMSEYLSDPTNRLIYVAFHGGSHWVTRDGRFV